jgi:hypothetical protein
MSLLKIINYGDKVIYSNLYLKNSNRFILLNKYNYQDLQNIIFKT